MPISLVGVYQCFWRMHGPILSGAKYTKWTESSVCYLLGINPLSIKIQVVHFSKRPVNISQTTWHHGNILHSYCRKILILAYMVCNTVWHNLNWNSTYLLKCDVSTRVYHREVISTENRLHSDNSKLLHSTRIQFSSLQDQLVLGYTSRDGSNYSIHMDDACDICNIYHKEVISVQCQSINYCKNCGN
jgi:hypothetical protein